MALRPSCFGSHDDVLHGCTEGGFHCSLIFFRYRDELCHGSFDPTQDPVPCLQDFFYPLEETTVVFFHLFEHFLSGLGLLQVLIGLIERFFLFLILHLDRFEIPLLVTVRLDMLIDVLFDGSHVLLSTFLDRDKALHAE